VPPAPKASWLPIESRLVIGALAFRVVSAFVAFLVNVTFPTHVDQRYSVLGRPNAFWDTFARYDSGWYFGIASQGYAYVEGGRSNLAFFPLYPTLMGWGGRLLGGHHADFYFAGIVISWVAFALAMAALYRLALLDLPHAQSLRAVLYASVFPAAHYFGVVYSEGLFLLGLIGAVLATRQRRWMWSALAGAAMTATRVNGVMFVPVLVWLAWRANPPGRERLLGTLAAGSAVCGIAAYSVYNYLLSGDALAWYWSIQRWDYRPGGDPFSSLFALWQAVATRPYQFLSAETMAPYDLLNSLSATLALVAVPLIWRRFGVSYAAIVVLGLVLPLSSGSLEGLARYCSVLFPLPIYLAAIGGETRHVVLIAAGAMLYTLHLALFTAVHPMY
jgi:Mannosyltransferase (PIG-V)